MTSYQCYQPLPFEFICILCKKQFTSPIVLDCFHIFDWPCLKRYLSGVLKSSQEISCPVCQKITSIPPSGEIFHLPTDYPLIKLIVQRSQRSQENPSASKPAHGIQQLLCSTCDLNLNDPAVAHCVECAGFLCESSTASHRQILSLKSHHVVRFEQLCTSPFGDTLSAHSVFPIARETESPQLLEARAKLAETSSSINLPALVSIATSFEIVRRKVDEKFLDIEKQFQESLNETINEKLIGKEKERVTRLKNLTGLVQDLGSTIDSVERLSALEKGGAQLPAAAAEELKKLERVLKERGGQASALAELVDLKKPGADQAAIIGQFTQAIFGLSFQFEPDKFERGLDKLLFTEAAAGPGTSTSFPSVSPPSNTTASPSCTTNLFSSL